MTDPLQKPTFRNLPDKVLHGLGWLLAALVRHLLVYITIGILIGMGLWLFGDVPMPEALFAGIAIMLMLIVISGAMS
ncbi:MAG: hypothetical protein ACK5II_01805 [Paracoccus sp. (in: a-proteobacteria)]